MKTTGKKHHAKSQGQSIPDRKAKALRRGNLMCLEIEWSVLPECGGQRDGKGRWDQWARREPVLVEYWLFACVPGPPQDPWVESRVPQTGMKKNTFSSSLASRWNLASPSIMNAGGGKKSTFAAGVSVTFTTRSHRYFQIKLHLLQISWKMFVHHYFRITIVTETAATSRYSMLIKEHSYYCGIVFYFNMNGGCLYNHMYFI